MTFSHATTPPTGTVDQAAAHAAEVGSIIRRMVFDEEQVWFASKLLTQEVLL
jgi:hypothetical protein